MRRPATYEALARLGRVQLSRHFYMRNFLYSEIAHHYRLSNLPEDPDLAIRAGRRLAEDLLEPLVETFGPIEIRSAYRSAEVNAFGNARGHQCAQNAASHANHIWDRRDAAGRLGAMATVVIPWFAVQAAAGRDWRDLAWWLYDHLDFDAVQVFPVNAAVNLGWREGAEKRISSYLPPRGHLLRAGEAPGEPLARRQARYADFPAFRGLGPPALPGAAADQGKA